MPPHRRPVTFLLSQLGSLASGRFAEALRQHDLTPGQAGVLRLISRHPAISQRALADRLGTSPSRMVVIIDALEQRDLVARTRSATDRRHQELSLTQAGADLLRALRPISEGHERAFLAGLDADELDTLGSLLEKVARAHGLDADVHPGYRAATDLN